MRTMQEVEEEMYNARRLEKKYKKLKNKAGEYCFSGVAQALLWIVNDQATAPTVLQKRIEDMLSERTMTH
jgi:hypothetical protein